MKHFNKIIIIILVVVVIGVSIFIYYEKSKNFSLNDTNPVVSTDKIINSVIFYCTENKNIQSVFYKNRVEIKLSDGRNMILPQVISASGARYANQDESFVFWNKGDTAFVNEGDITTFKDCSINIHDATYIIEGEDVTLKNGMSEVEAAPGSVSKIITKYFGNDVVGDFDNDGRDDLAFLLTQETGGSGTFYYVVALLNKEGGKVGTSAVFLGDRIAPQTTELKGKDILVVNYADRKTEESFAIKPSVGKSIFLKLNPATLQFNEVSK